MYARCGAVAPAKELFDTYPSRNVYTWNALIGGLADGGQGREALNYFERMQCAQIAPDPVTFAYALKACGSIRAIDRGVQIHDSIARQGFLDNNSTLSNTIISMYAKCSAFEKAHQVLEELPNRDVISWNALIAGYVQHGRGEKAWDCFERMQCEGLSPDAVTFLSMVKACSTMKAVHKGEKIHREISAQGLLCDNSVLQNALLDMYVKCGSLAKARQVLFELPHRDVISWSTLIAGYVQQGDGDQAISCFNEMKREGISPNTVTYISLLQACGSIGSIEKGEEIHYEVRLKGILNDNLTLGNSIVDMYAKCGAFTKARKMLESLPVRDVVSWTSLIGGYIQHGKCEQALDCFEQMQREGVNPNAVTFICVLKACGSIGATAKGDEIYEVIAKQGLLKSDGALGNALVDMYARCGALMKARHVLDELPMRDVITWSALIAGYAEQGEGEQVMDCFLQMRHEGLCPNPITYISILKTCGGMGAIAQGKTIHDEIAKQNLLGTDIILDTALVDMYAKCNSLAKAKQLLEEIPTRDTVSWNALIAAYVQEGESEHALRCFKQMQCEGVSPDPVTFLCVLNACSHLGKAEDATFYLGDMDRSYGMNPDPEHYNCIVDLFARMGHLTKAVRVMKNLPLQGGSGACSALLAACEKWGHADVGSWAFDYALQVDQNDPAFYILMANIHAVAHIQNERKKI
ncbi:hypothetical protein KP509_14G063100 [Ceratopteris richardii]|nr:hypothetical protein KP509_14G063100 [Ceratopteris richardii]